MCPSLVSAFSCFLYDVSFTRFGVPDSGARQMSRTIRDSALFVAEEHKNDQNLETHPKWPSANPLHPSNNKGLVTGRAVEPQPL